MRLRVAPARAEARGRFARPLPAHRDSWGSGLACQINWWAPIFPLAPARTMWIWPDLFDQPLPNTAAEWDYDRVIAGGDPTYPLLPEIKGAPPTAGAPVMIEPGSILLFSAAHLHASVAADPARARLSLDTRTAWPADDAAGRGAPLVDQPPGPARWDMFGRPTSGPETEIKRQGAAG